MFNCQGLKKGAQQEQVSEITSSSPIRQNLINTAESQHNESLESVQDGLPCFSVISVLETVYLQWRSWYNYWTELFVFFFLNKTSEIKATKRVAETDGRRNECRFLKDACGQTLWIVQSLIISFHHISVSSLIRVLSCVFYTPTWKRLHVFYFVLSAHQNFWEFSFSIFLFCWVGEVKLLLWVITSKQRGKFRT